MKIPTLEAILTDEETGISVISWVTNPATQVDMLCFKSKEAKELRFADDEQHLVTSVVMLADTKIYRETSDGQPYYIFYSRETLKQMCEKMLKDGVFNTCSFEHNGEIIPDGNINLVELYTKDNTKQSPFNVPDGSIIATYKVHNDDIWTAFKSGEIGGISLEGTFGLSETQFSSVLEDTKTLKQKYMDILQTLKDLIVDIEAQEQNPAIASEQLSEEPTPSEEPTEEPAEEPTEEPKKDEELEAVKESIAALETSMSELVSRIEAIETALAESTPTPVEEEPTVEEVEDKYTRMGKLFKNK